MNSAQIIGLQGTRGRVFFWIGMLILPVFWIWWMTPRWFTPSQRRLGWIWTLAYLGLIAIIHSRVTTHLTAVMLGYPEIAIRLTLALSLWLVIRVIGIGNFVVMVLVS